MAGGKAGKDSGKSKQKAVSRYLIRPFFKPLCCGIVDVRTWGRRRVSDNYEFFNSRHFSSHRPPNHPVDKDEVGEGGA